MKKQDNKIKIQRTPISHDTEKLPKITITAEREVTNVELDIDIDPKVLAVLAEAGWETIQGDETALANYAIVKALEDLIKNEKEKDARHIA